MIQAKQINVIALAIVLFATTIAFYSLAKKAKVMNISKNFTIPDLFPTAGLSIPVLETYGGIKGLGYINFMQNDISPEMILFEDSMEYRILTRKSATYRQIEYVRSRSFLFFHLIQFSFYDRPQTFSAHLANAEILYLLMDFLHARGVPVKS